MDRGDRGLPKLAAAAAKRDFALPTNSTTTTVSHGRSTLPLPTVLLLKDTASSTDNRQLTAI